MGQDLRNWNIEDEGYWASTGKAIATRNLWISIPSLLCGFAVWLYWGIITVQMLNLGFEFEKSDLFTLGAIAGLAGATLRIPSTFFIRIAGGRNTIFFTTALLMIPAIGAGMALQNPDTPLWQFQILALLSGIGGGNFSSSMSNISFFYPKKIQGYALGMNAGLGNFGVTTMQIVIPLVMTFGLFGGESRTLVNTSGTLIGKIPAGTETYIQNAGLVWLLALVPLAFLGWFGMNNIRDEHVSPDIPNPIGAFATITGMLAIGFATSIFGLWLLLPDKLGGARVTQWISIVMVACALGVAYFIQAAYASATPEQYFYPFLGLFLILFAATGIGNGSTFRTIAVVFNKEQAGPALGWTAAVAAYGAFIIPQVFGEQLSAGTPEYALYGFAVFYAVCIAINWWFYLRPGAYVKNP